MPKKKSQGGPSAGKPRKAPAKRTTAAKTPRPAAKKSTAATKTAKPKADRKPASGKKAAKAAKAAKAVAKAAPVAAAPAEEQIRERALKIWIDGGRRAGTALNDWLAAEQQLQGEIRRS